MAISFTPDDVASGFNLTKLNNNFDKVDTALQDALSRSGQGPNQMNADIDLNSNDLLNVRRTNTDELYIDGALVTPDALATIPSNVMLKTTYDPTIKLIPPMYPDDYDPQGKLSDAFLSSNHDFLQTGVGAVERSVQNKLRETVSVKDFGAVGDGVTNDTAAFSAAFAASSFVHVPKGTYVLASTPTAPTGSMHLQGDGSGQTKLLITHGGTRALHFTPASENSHVAISGITMKAGNSAGPVPLGIEIAFPSVASYPYSQVLLDDIRWEGDLSSVTAPWSNTWGRGLKLQNVWNPWIYNISGSSYPEPGTTAATGFLEVTGGSFGLIGASISDVRWYYGAAAILGSAYIEGLTLTNYEFVGVTRGVYVPSTTPVGGAGLVNRALAIWLSDGHIAAHTDCVNLDTASDLRIGELNYQRWADASATNWAGIRINQVEYPLIQNGTIAGNESSGGITTVGIIATGANTAHGIVGGIHFENLDTQFDLAAATTSWTITDNRSTGATADVYVLGGTKHHLTWLKNDGVITYTNDSLNGPISTGTYTPTLTGVSNVDAATALPCQFMRVGDIVNVSGRFDLNPTTNGVLTLLGISLPVASDFSALEQCGGTASTTTQGVAGAILADFTNNRAELSILPNTAANHGLAFHFMYRVI